MKSARIFRPRLPHRARSRLGSSGSRPMSTATSSPHRPLRMRMHCQTCATLQPSVSRSGLVARCSPRCGNQHRFRRDSQRFRKVGAHLTRAATARVTAMAFDRLRHCRRRFAAFLRTLESLLLSALAPAAEPVAEPHPDPLTWTLSSRACVKTWMVLPRARVCHTGLLDHRTP